MFAHLINISERPKNLTHRLMTRFCVNLYIVIACQVHGSRGLCGCLGKKIKLSNPFESPWTCFPVPVGSVESFRWQITLKNGSAAFAADFLGKGLLEVQLKGNDLICASIS